MTETETEKDNVTDGWTDRQTTDRRWTDTDAGKQTVKRERTMASAD